MDPLVTMTAATGTNPTAAEAKTYTFTDPMHARVFNMSTSGVTMHVRWNSDDATAADSKWDTYLAGGDLAESPPLMGIRQVGIWFSGAATYGTDFIVKGRPFAL